jgi:transposase
MWRVTRPAKEVVVMETCDTSGWVYDIAVALALGVLIANPSNEAWRWTRVKRKTDRDDALKVARMTDRGDIPPVYMPSPQQSPATPIETRQGTFE